MRNGPNNLDMIFLYMKNGLFQSQFCRKNRDFYDLCGWASIVFLKDPYFEKAHSSLHRDRGDSKNNVQMV